VSEGWEEKELFPGSLCLKKKKKLTLLFLSPSLFPRKPKPK